MAIIWLQTSKTHNNIRIVFLILLMPLVVFLSLLLYFNIFDDNINNETNTEWEVVQLNSNLDNELIDDKINTPLKNAYTYFLYSLPIILLWLIIWVSLQKSIIFKYTWANELKRSDNEELYNTIENLCISRGLPLPKIWIIEDKSMNAFATWWNTKNSHIVFSRWLLNALNKEEIEAVAWHELTHIINGDVKTMVIVNVFIWIIWTIWYILMRSGWNTSWSKKWGNPLIILWLILYIVSLLILPFINMAISRKKEFLADAWSVELTKNKNSMISALNKISKDSIIEKVSRRNSTVASMFIFDPKVHKKSFFSKVKNLFSTHPSLKERIELLEKY